MAVGSVVPLVIWKQAAGAEHRAQGMPLRELFAAVRRLVWSSPAYSDSRRRSAARTAQLAESLPEHPAPDDVAAWVEALRRVFPSEHTVSLHLRTLSTVYAHGADLGLSTGNPAKVISKTARKPGGDPRPLRDLERAWLAMMEVCRTDRERLFLGLMRYAGLRRSEALGVWHSDVNTHHPEGWKLEIVRQRPKPNDLVTTKPKTPSSARELPVRGPLRELLAPVLAEGEPVVRVGRGGGERARVSYLCPLREQDLADLGERIRAAVPGEFPRGHKLWHALRDSFAVELFRAGKSRSDVSHALGHSGEYVTTTHYLGVIGRAVHRDAFAGLDPPGRGPAPPGACPACGAESREATAATVAPRRSSKASSQQQAVKPAAGGPPCSTPSRSGKSSRTPSTPSSPMRSASGAPGGSARTQRALPGLAVGPVVTRGRGST